MDLFDPPVRSWFAASFAAPTEVQRRGWPAIAAGRHALLVAPTGTGKTLAAFLWGIDRLARLPHGAAPGVRLVYVSPLKALVYDVERNLRAPLAGIRRKAAELGADLRPLRVAVRTGDTPQTERRRLARDPAEILVTTPESLFLILGTGAREALRGVEAVIVDEIHALAPEKRGTHLALSLERLAELAAVDPQRIGLSATVRPLDEVARFLGGDRPVEVVDASQAPRLALRIAVPVPDMERVPPPAPEDAPKGRIDKYQPGAPMSERGIWPALYPALVEEIRAHRSTILFVNSRGLAERLSQRLNALAGEELALAHHGSVSREKRAAIETALKEGRLRAIVATSSLELGIDMGAVDHVVLVESPGSVARGLQRVGRAGHQVGATSSGSFYPKFRGDLLECAAVAEGMLHGRIEALRVPRNALDVLAQQIVAMCCDGPRAVGAIERVVRRAHPYRELAPDALRAVLDMLSGRYPSSDLADLRPRLRWDRAADVVEARPGALLVTRMNAGTIPDRGAFAVHLGADGPRVGELDEEMVYESRDGDTFLLGATTWRIEAITQDRVIVSPAPGEPGRLPFWKGDGPGRPAELGRALGAFTREIGALPRGEAERRLRERLPLDENAAANLAAYVHEQREHTGALPTDRSITVERFRDELGDWRVCILTPFGARIHAPWAMALERRLGERAGVEVQLMYTDDGIALRFADVEDLPGLDLLLPEPDEVEDLVARQLASTSLFAALFRENAVRSLLVTRRRPDQRSPLWAQRIKARGLLATVQRHPGFPVVLETYRQALSDVLDLAGLAELLRRIRAREVGVHEVETRTPSPFARSLVFAYVAAYLYDGDSPAAERRAQALTLDRGLLAELLGRADLRELLDPLAIAAVEAELAGLAPERRARDRDELHDLLRRIGDLSAQECAARCAGDAREWLARLSAEQRAAEVDVAGERRWIAAEDAGLYRDALGCAPPEGVPRAFLAPIAHALERLLGRWARARGPFQAEEAARRFGLSAAAVELALRALEREGALVHGELRPGGTRPDWCEADVLRRIKRRTLARLRGEAAPVDGPALARFLVRWHGIDGASPAAGLARLDEVVAQLEGLALPWSALARELLPRRVRGFAPELLDLASAAGRVVWIGKGALGPHDGRVALYRRERVAALLAVETYAPPSDIHAAILRHLEARGASFLIEVERAVRAAHPGLTAAELEAALWDLVWARQVTNDTFQPLRALGRRARGPARRGSALAGGRWSLVAELARGAPGETERALARAEMLLERYGIVSREAALFEDLPGGFGPIHQVLRAMEDAGRVRRGYFVAGLSGAQLGRPGAIDRLRDARGAAAVLDGSGGPGAEPELVELCAADPANPYGALLAWPASGGGERRPRRSPRARVVLDGGRPVLYVGPGRRELVTFPPSPDVEQPQLLLALRALCAAPRRGRGLVVETIDGLPAQESPHRAALLAAGFVADYRGFIPDPARARP